MKAHICFLFLITIGFLPGVADQPDLKKIQAEAAQGNALAEYQLGKAYHLGQGVPVDYVKAAALYRQAAAQGNAKSMFNLGYIYKHGQGVPVDGPTAVQWYQKAADLGLPAGQLEIGLEYYFGDLGVKRDFVVAAKWLTLAAKQDNSPAQCAPAANALGAILEHGWAGIPIDGQQAVFWYTKAANLGDARAQSNLGRVYNEGNYVKRDPVLSYMWLKISASQGEITAKNLLAQYSTAHIFTDAQKAEGEKRVSEYMAKHPRPPIILGPHTSEDAPAAVTNSVSGQNPPGH